MLLVNDPQDPKAMIDARATSRVDLGCTARGLEQEMGLSGPWTKWTSSSKASVQSNCNRVRWRRRTDFTLHAEEADDFPFLRAFTSSHSHLSPAS